MLYSIGLYFDPITDQLVRETWKLLAEKKWAEYYALSENRPHITLSIFKEVDVARAAQVLEEISSSINKFSLPFRQIGLFTGSNQTVFWGPVVTHALLDLQLQIHQIFCEFGTRPDFDYYYPDHWIPHCGLAMEISDPKVVPQIIEICQTLPNPHMSWVTEIGLISFRPVKQLLNFSFFSPPENI